MGAGVSDQRQISPDEEIAETKEAFRRYLRQQGLKYTRQREIILDAFLDSGEHLSAEALYLHLRDEHPKIGYATVYRTLKLLAACGIAVERHFADRQTCYESCTQRQHYHLICSVCGRIVEFEEKRIDALLQEVSQEHGFQLNRRRLELYGICPNCARHWQS